MNASEPLVLLIEDNQSVSKLIEFKLQRSGYRFEHYENGAKGLDAALELKPDAIVLDVMLPGMTGFEILRRIRQDDSLNGTKILMLTTKTRDEDIEQGFKLKADEYMGKPFKVNEFMLRLERLLETESAAE
jgi:DNA-binding response OmpR family regulator